MRGIYGRLLLLALGLAAGLFAAEGIFRGFVLVPKVPRTESHFRKVVSWRWPRPMEIDKPEGTLRILGLGDSFGASGGDGNYHFVMERALRERGLPVEVVNFSVGGYGLNHERQLLERFGARYRPDLVLHSVFTGNDFAIFRDETLLYKGIPVAPVPGWKSWLPGNWLLPAWLGRFAAARREQARVEDERETEQETGAFTEESFLRIEAVRMSTFKRPIREVYAWPEVTDELDRIIARTREMGARYLLVAHPDQVQIEPALRARVCEAHGLDEEAYDMDLTSKFLSAYAGLRQIPIVDLTPAFREEGAGGGLYLPYDTHYNAEGNRLAARLIQRAVEPVISSRAGSPRPPEESPDPLEGSAPARRSSPRN